MDERGKSPIAIDDWLKAAARGDVESLVEALNRGVAPDALGIDHSTALMKAVEGCHLDLIRLLLDRGADPNAEDIRGYTAVSLGIVVSWPENPHWKTSRGDRGPLELLLAAGGHMRLCEAVLANDAELVRTRLDEGADANTGRGTYFGPLLKQAAELGHVDIVALLLDRGADIEAEDDLGQRPLQCAARFGQTEVVRLLLDRGADLNAVDWSGQTALSNAAIEGHLGLCDLLRSRGAHRGLTDALAAEDTALFENLLDAEAGAGHDINVLSDGRARLPVIAVQRGNVAIVRLLLDRGAALVHE
jgi:ankyrin repeat protein